MWGGLSGMIFHGENQPCSPAQELLLARVQLSLQSFLGRAAVALTPLRSRRRRRRRRGAVNRDGRVAVRQRQVAVRQDEVRVGVLKLLAVLRSTGTTGR